MPRYQRTAPIFTASRDVVAWPAYRYGDAHAERRHRRCDDRRVGAAVHRHRVSIGAGACRIAYIIVGIIGSWRDVTVAA